MDAALYHNLFSQMVDYINDILYPDHRQAGSAAPSGVAQPEASGAGPPHVCAE
jgi:hypothetical protein